MTPLLSDWLMCCKASGSPNRVYINDAYIAQYPDNCPLNPLYNGNTNSSKGLPKETDKLLYGPDGIRRERLRTVRKEKISNDETKFECLKEQQSKENVIKKKLEEANELSTRFRALKAIGKGQQTLKDDEVEQNRIDQKELSDELKKQSDVVAKKLDDKNRIKKRLDEETKKDEVLCTYLCASIDDDFYQQLEFNEALTDVIGLETKTTSTITDLWNILKRSGKIEIANYDCLSGWLIYFSDIFDASHMIDEINETEDAILDPYDTKEERSFSDYQKRNNVFLGRGGFGTVHLYQHDITDEQIAVKEITFQPNETTKEDEAFLVEVKIMRELSRFNHPNIIRYFFEHIDVDSGTFYIGMEYMTGGSLAGKIKGSPLPKDNLRTYTHQILCGVKFLHEKHIAHRDIKPHNILLGSNDRIKLMDFGIAKELSTSLLSHGATTAGAGTNNYLSPEAATGYRIDEKTKGYGLKTDIWSTGCVVLEMTTGKRPWNGYDPTTVIYPIGMGNTPPIADDVPSDVKAFLALTFIVDPAKRPTAEDLLKDKLLAGITSDDSGKAGTSSADRGYAVAGITSDRSGKAGTSSADRGNAVVGGGSRYLHPVSSFGGLETAVVGGGSHYLHPVSSFGGLETADLYHGSYNSDDSSSSDDLETAVAGITSAASGKAGLSSADSGKTGTPSAYSGNEGISSVDSGNAGSSSANSGNTDNCCRQWNCWSCFSRMWKCRYTSAADGEYASIPSSDSA
ncbi:ovarian-specific serine/threonine-protein kinase Lok-like [Lineus longissimus]|uniref:ovarian-specific serine/threonine-protein kinase Lok-like n=1 Tax=Lineus longissimus TaxID=88925 RepID=UPI00315C7419